MRSGQVLENADCNEIRAALNEGNQDSSFKIYRSELKPGDKFLVKCKNSKEPGHKPGSLTKQEINYTIKVSFYRQLVMLQIR